MSVEDKKHENNGFIVECLHSGQKRAYGDTYKEFSVKSDKPESEVKQYCIEQVCPCKLSTDRYLAEKQRGFNEFGDHFRYHYSFRKRGEGDYFYRVTQPSTH